MGTVRVSQVTRSQVTGSNQPVRGSLGNQSGYGALQALEIMQASGTLLLEQSSPDTDHPTRYWLGLWSGGQHRHFALGEPLELSATGLSFTFYAHRAEAKPLPQFGSGFPQSSAAMLRALPALGATRLSVHDTDLRALVTRLARERFTGILAALDQNQDRRHEGAMLLFSGRIGAAFHEYVVEGKRGERTTWGSNALRATLQLTDQRFAQPAQTGSAQTAGEAWLELRALPPLICASLLGLAQDQVEHQDQTGADEKRSGVEVSSVGYTYYNAGLPTLFIAHTAEVRRDALGFYVPAYSAPGLRLPSEPPGWEEQRYHLTLRGRDALNPMTELAMRFEREFGRTGHQTLTQLARRLAVADVAKLLSVEPNELRPHVEKLEAESLIRKAER